MTVSLSSDQPLKAALPGAEMPQDMPYRSLSRSIIFPNMAQHRYWHQVAPMLGKILSDGKYTTHQQYEYLSLFANFIVPMLGPFPGEKGLYKCMLGGTGSVELSQNFQQSSSTARIAFEPTSYTASTGGDPFNRFTVNTTLAQLRIMGISVNLQLHQALVNELTLTDGEEQLMTLQEISETPFRTQTLLALDLTKTGVKVKEYFYPTVKAAVTGQSVAKLCFDAIRKVDVQGRYEAPCKIIESHMQRQDQTDLYFVSCDLVDPLETRFKVYLLELNATLPKVEEHWTLGGILTDEETMLGLKMVRQLWMDFGIIEGQRVAPDRPTQPGDSSTHVSFIINYEMNPGQPLPTPKFYFPLTGISDMKVASVLTAFFQHHGMRDQAAAYTENFKSYYLGKDLDIVTDHQAWLSFSYTEKGGPYLTMYYH